MEAHRFDTVTRLFAGNVSRRIILRTLLGAGVSSVISWRGRHDAAAQGIDLPLGSSCNESFECWRGGGHPICANNGMGGLACCLNQGGACGEDRDCCGSLLCEQGVCGGGGFPVGASCRDQSQCAPLSPDDGWATCAYVGSTSAATCCLATGSWCSFDSECCGEDLCQPPGICGGVLASGLPTGAYCADASLCSYRAADACADNGVVDDGPTNCCWHVGGFCTEDAHCCGTAGCVDGMCGGEASGDAPPDFGQNPASVAVWLSRKEAAGDSNALYDWIHPDAHAVVPRSAVAGWYENQFFPLGPGIIDVTGVTYGAWTWPVTGATYPGVAEVSFRQSFANGTVISDVVRLAQDDEGRWRWFFGRSPEFVAEQIARYSPGGPLSGESGRVGGVIDDLDAFWSGAFAAARQFYDSPGVIEVTDPVDSACGTFAPGIGALYCFFDQTIFFESAFFAPFHENQGDFAWKVILAHEWGHHVQRMLDIWPTPGNAFELQADCLAGAYARDAGTRGWLNPGDVMEAVTSEASAGDPLWLPQDQLGAHGRGDDRIAAFMRGYLDGFLGCQLPLAPDA